MIAVKTAYTYTYYTRNFMMLKVRKELYINLNINQNVFKAKKYTAHFARCGVFKERCMMKRYV